MSRPDATPTATKLTIPFSEYIVLSAFLTALTALSIDIMLPALPHIGAHFALENPNDRQLVVISYFVGFAVGQLFWGPISDRFGRIPVLSIGLALFSMGALGAIWAPDYDWLLAARILQGIGGAASRVTVTAIVRDLFEGARMSRVMSIIMTVFILIPVLAPLIGQGLLYIGDWKLHFIFILIAGATLLVWASFRMPETRPVHLRRGGWSTVITAFMHYLSNRVSVTYTLATGMIFGCLCTFIVNAQQIIGELYEFGDAFALVFGSVALAMAAASLTNARIVLRRGMRRVCHGALLAFVVLSAVLLMTTLLVHPPAYVFLGCLAALFFLFSLITPNLNAIALEPMGAIAGLASSMVGFVTTILAAVLGWLFGSAYDGTLIPFSLSFFILSLLCLLLVFSVEGRAGM
ncbi:MAG: multidrug effflux MFS transporter, partial [Pseudomonadota bacterium]